MISVTIFQNHNHQNVGFQFEGHAGFARHGRDIVCAGVSTLCINTINSIEEFTDVSFSCEIEEKSGKVDFMLKDPANGDTELLINSMILGLKGIQKDYGKKYVILNFKEV